MKPKFGYPKFGYSAISCPFQLPGMGEVKQQYLGDANDYRKYALLRHFAEGGRIRIGVCWMLTAPDGRNDGSHLAYLDKPAKFRRFDPELFDWLQQTIQQYPDRRTAGWPAGTPPCPPRR